MILYYFIHLYTSIIIVYKLDNLSSDIRKIQFTGRSTYILSLPKKWIEEMKLKAGDHVSISRNSNNSLCITPEKEKRLDDAVNEVTTLVLIDEAPNTLKRKIVSIYLAGYNLINLKSKIGRIQPIQREAVREIVRRSLIGTEIIADSSDIITIQILLTLPELSVNTAVRRMFLIASSMHRDVIIALKEKNFEIANGVIKSDDEVDRFSLYILRNLVMATNNERVLQEIGLKYPSDCLSYRVTVKSIERVADHATRIAIKCLEIDKDVSLTVIEKLEKLSNLALEVLTSSVEAFLRRDYNLADKIADKSENVLNYEREIMKFLDSIENKNDQNTGANIKLILEDIRRTVEHASDIAESAMNQTVGEIIKVEKRLGITL
jgi:phosphate uptake regulator